MSHDDADKRKSDPFLQQAYGLKDLEAAMSFYDQWAEQYDDQMEQKLGYVAPRLMAESLAAYVSDKSTPVLDVGCGTGLTSQYLSDLGFQLFDGIDITPRMLERARERGIYRSLIEADVTQPLDLESSSYEAIISSGTFTLGHVGCEAIPELVRVLKSGGYLGCTIHENLWTDAGFEQTFREFQDRETLRAVAKTPGEFFKGLGETALYCVFQKA